MDMKSINFTDYLESYIKSKKIIITEKVALHTSHLEDLLFEKGNRGFFEAIRNLNAAIDLLSGKESNISLSEKIDGRVAIFFGTDPDDGRLFVGNKSSFAKNAKKAKSEKDIDAMYGGKGDLPIVLKKALKNLAPHAKGSIYQGDLLWGSKSDLKKTSSGYEFTPNTITYSIDEDSLPELGIAVHTKYEGKNWDSMTGTNSFFVDPLRKSGYFILDPKIKNSNSNIDSLEMKKELSLILKTFSSFSKSSALLKNELVKEFLPIWINSRIREGKDQSFVSKDWSEFISFISLRYDKKIEDLKTDKGKDKWRKEKDSFISLLKSQEKRGLAFFNSYNSFLNVKNKILKALEGKEQLKGSIDGQETGEGWVLLSKGGKFVKLVDRNEFSRLNFNLSKNRKVK